MSNGKIAVRLRNSAFGMARSTISPSSFSTVTRVTAVPRSVPLNARARITAATIRLTGMPTFSVNVMRFRPGLPWNQASMSTVGRNSSTVERTTRVQCGDRRNSFTAKWVNCTQPHDTPM